LSGLTTTDLLRDEFTVFKVNPNELYNTVYRFTRTHIKISNMDKNTKVPSLMLRSGRNSE